MYEFYKQMHPLLRICFSYCVYFLITFSFGGCSMLWAIDIHIIHILFLSHFFSGIGYQIVLGLASRGCRIIIADINVDEEIKDKIYKETHNPNIILKYINLGSFKSVREFAEELNKTEPKIDILVNNAGIGQGLSAVTEDGLNLVMQVNYYSAFLLTHLLLGKNENVHTK